DAPQTIPGPDFGFVPYIDADRVAYSDAAPWPTSPDGSGDALKKVTSNLYGNEALNWQGGAPSPGAANFAAATNSPPVLNAIANRSVHVGYPATFTATASDADLPAQVLQFSLDAPAPSGASIGSGSGAFTWTPTTNQGPATYTITVRVTDNGSPALSDTKTFQIAVLRLPRVSSVELTNGMVNITWESYAGRRYRVETTADLANPNWTQVGNDIVAGGNSSTLTVLGGTDVQRFYRVISYDN
ncbi:MAG TPA: cadherin repeat domain-containing protein, partial [Opitutaceae bacterium]|nr:cadherin repeat domain-containing protein [Opitutaceae bacterium]